MRYIVTDATFLIFPCCFKAARIQPASHLSLLNAQVHPVYFQLPHSYATFDICCVLSRDITFSFSQLELQRVPLQLIFVYRCCNETSTNKKTKVFDQRLTNLPMVQRSIFPITSLSIFYFNIYFNIYECLIVRKSYACTKKPNQKIIEKLDNKSLPRRMAVVIKCRGYTRY